MASLLTPQQRAAIRTAIRDVTDTFMVTPIKYYIGVDSLDRWGEDAIRESFKAITFNALQEDERDKLEESIQGSLDLQATKLTVNLEDLIDLQLITADKTVKFDADKDYFESKGILYKVKDIYYDGPLDSQDVLVVVIGTKQEYTNNLKHVTQIADGSGL